MPPVVGAAIAGALGAVGSAWAAGTLAALTWSTVITSALTSAVMAGVGMLLQPKPKKGGVTPSGVTSTTRNPVAYRVGVYGKRRVGGTIIYINTRGDDNKYLDLVVAVASHEIHAFKEVWFGDELAWDDVNGESDRFNDHSAFDFKTGGANQTASTLFDDGTGTNYWDSTCRCRGVAHVCIKLAFDAQTFPGGIPSLSFVIEGQAWIPDPRTGVVTYSTNPALCIRHFLMDSNLGMGVPAEEIDDDSFMAAANLADESIYSGWRGGNESRFTMNGVFDANTEYGTLIESMLTSMGARITYSGGKYRMILPAYTAPTVALDESHMIGGVKVQPRRGRRDRYNGVRGSFAPADDNWVEGDYPPVVSDTYQAQDGEPIWKDLPLEWTTSSSMCQRLAKVELLRGRQQVGAVLQCNLAAMELVPGTTVSVTNERLGWDAKVFEIQSWVFAPQRDGSVGINVTVMETSSAVFDWTASDETMWVAGTPTDLPNGFTIGAPGITLSEEDRSQNQDVITVLVIDVASPDTFAESYEVEYKLSTDSTYRSAGRAYTGRYEVLKVTDGSTYDVRARCRGYMGNYSNWNTASYTVVGSASPPPDVTGFNARASGATTELRWGAVDDLRLSHYVIRHTSKTSGATWGAATTVVPRVARPGTSVSVPSQSGTYLIKAVDKLGQYSTNAATILSPVSATEGLNVVLTVTEAPGFSTGTASGTTVSTGTLVLDASVTWDNLTGLWDSQSGNWDSLSGDLLSSGTYTSAAQDLGGVFPCRIFLDLQYDATGGANAWDAQVGNWDAQPGLWDDVGGGAEIPGLEAYVELRHTNDDPAGTPTWTDWAQLTVNEVEGRGFQFRTTLTTDDVTATPAVDTLTYTIDMPDRVLRGVDISSGTASGGKAISFSSGAFYSSPAIGVTPQDTVQGDFFELLSKSATGFTVRFKNATGTVVDRTFDWDAKGYGRVIT